jgi:hypothetical protein
MFNGDSGLLPGRVVTSAFAVVFREDPSPPARSAQGVELVMAEGASALLWNGTDWTLGVARGSWPGLPGWAWPVESWEFAVLPGPIGERAGEISSVTPTRNRVGEIDGVVLGFAGFRLELTSGESLCWAVVDEQSEG